MYLFSHPRPRLTVQRYKDNTWVAGYNPLNEPTDEEHYRLLDFYARISAVIREIDPHHILFLEWVHPPPHVPYAPAG